MQSSRKLSPTSLSSTKWYLASIRHRAGLRRMFEMFHAGFQDASIQVDDIISRRRQGVRARSHNRSARQGEYVEISVSGNDIDINVCDYFRFDGRE